MKVSVYYTDTRVFHAEGLMETALEALPIAVSESILRYKFRKDRLLAYAGKLLLLQSLHDLSPNGTLTLEDLKYTRYSRPYFEHPLDFNITHSGSHAVLAITAAGTLGVDIELKGPIDFNDFKGIFTGEEWTMIKGCPDPNQKFYEIWTKKEAIVKAVGRGLNIPFTAFGVDQPEVMIEGELFYLAPLPIDMAYEAHLATAGNRADINIQHVDLAECTIQFLERRAEKARKNLQD